MGAVMEISKKLGIPEEELLHKGIVSFLEKEIRLAEEEIADLREKYGALSSEELYAIIESRDIDSHPA